jgi:hypothetical protein
MNLADGAGTYDQIGASHGMGHHPKRMGVA